MMTFKHQMTPDELSELTGYSPQTINKWIREQGWHTAKLQGVKGGKAHVIVMDEKVRRYILNTRKMRVRYPEFSRAEEPMTAYANAQENSERQIIDAVRMMSEAEQQRLALLLVREGVAGMLRKLGIDDPS